MVGAAERLGPGPGPGRGWTHLHGLGVSILDDFACDLGLLLRGGQLQLQNHTHEGHVPTTGV